MSTAERIDELRNRFTENPRRYFASLANELRKAGQAEEAIAICRRLLPTLPGHMSGYVVLGQALYETERLDEARSVFEEALSHDPENLIALRHLGDIDRRQGNPAAARRWYERVLEADPRNDDIASHLMMMGTPVREVVTEAPIPGVVAEAAVPALVAEEVAAVVAEEVTAVVAAPPVADVLPEVPLPVGAPEAPLSVTGARRALDPTEDPFGFGVPLEEVIAVETPFEEGLVAPDWPDTAALVARRSGERVAVPIGDGGEASLVAPPATADVVAAFGAEPNELPPPRMPGDGQPWISEPPRKTREVEVIAEAIAEDARASGEPDGVAVFAHPDPDHGEVTPFSDVHPEMAVDSFATETMGELLASQGLIDQAIGVYEALVRQRPEAPALADRLAALRAQQAAPPASAPAPWRTARERFAALAARTVRRRTIAGPVAPAPPAPPAPPVPPVPMASGPMAPTVQVAAVVEAPPATTPFVTNPAVASTQRSLASLFGSPAPVDEAAASTLSGMFGGDRPEPAAATGTTAWLDALNALPAQVVPEPRAPTPWGASPALEPDEPLGFDRAFPDPGRSPAEPVVDPQTANDLAEFSAWLKGLGSP